MNFNDKNPKTQKVTQTLKVNEAFFYCASDLEGFSKFEWNEEKTHTSKKSSWKVSTKICIVQRKCEITKPLFSMRILFGSFYYFFQIDQVKKAVDWCIARTSNNLNSSNCSSHVLLFNMWQKESQTCKIVFKTSVQIWKNRRDGNPICILQMTS